MATTTCLTLKKTLETTCLHSHTALTISTISRGAVKTSVSCYTIKLDFLTLTPSPPVEKWFPRTCQDLLRPFDQTTVLAL